jgi:hypothetical protein
MPDAPGGMTVSKTAALPEGDFGITEYTWGPTTLWFIDQQEFTADEREFAYHGYRQRESTMACECGTCRTGRRLKSVAATLAEDDSKWLRELGDELAHAQMDRDYYRSIVDGDWPNSVEILEAALERAKSKRLEENEP